MGFVELAPRSPATPMTTTSVVASQIKILLGNGCVVATAVDVDPLVFARLLDAVEGGRRRCDDAGVRGGRGDPQRPPPNPTRWPWQPLLSRRCMARSLARGTRPKGGTSADACPLTAPPKGPTIGSPKASMRSQSDSTFTLKRFRLAGHGHLHAARCILEAGKTASSPVPVLALASACYLVQVALECGLKARILARGGCVDVEELKRKLPKVYDPLFVRKQGHDLGKLAEELGLNRLMATMGKGLRQDDCWQRLTSSARPYSLRYGTEDVDDAMTTEEVERCAEVLTVLLDGLVRTKRRRPEKK